MFCACCSSTPQLIAGARSPTPRKLSAVSPRIMLGIASVSEAIKWLSTPGTRYWNSSRGVPALSIRAAVT